ncbi:MAG: hypothetical protein H7210_13555 [Pyrinomonadaceae bacterium]|nr:hypothetical protein [Phycisphaerales bacterium]
MTPHAKTNWPPPPTLVRYITGIIVLNLMILSGCIGLVFASGAANSALVIAAVVASAVGGVVGTLLLARNVKQLQRTLADHQGHLCPRCEHPLPPEQDGFRTCTECGLHEPDAAHLAFWKKWSQFKPGDETKRPD